MENTTHSFEITWDNFCPFCKYYKTHEGICNKLQEDIQSNPLTFIKNCYGKLYSKNVDVEKTGRESTKINAKIFNPLSYIIDLTVFFVLLLVFDVPFLPSFIISEVVGWSIRAIVKAQSGQDSCDTTDSPKS